MPDIERLYGGLEDLYAHVDNADGLVSRGFEHVRDVQRSQEAYEEGMVSNGELGQGIAKDFGRILLKLRFLAAGLEGGASTCQYVHDELAGAHRAFAEAASIGHTAAQNASRLLGAEDPIAGKVEQLKESVTKIDDAATYRSGRAEKDANALRTQHTATAEVMKLITQAFMVFDTMSNGLPNLALDSPNERTKAILSKEEPAHQTAEEARSLIADRVSRL